MDRRENLVAAVCVSISAILVILLYFFKYLPLIDFAILVPMVVLIVYVVYEFRETIRKSPNVFLALSVVFLLLFFIFNLPILSLLVYYFNYLQGLGQPLIYSQIPIANKFISQGYYAPINIALVVLSFAMLVLFFYINRKSKRREPVRMAADNNIQVEPAQGSAQ